MSNIYDQFDSVAAKGSNPYDQFDTAAPSEPGNFMRGAKVAAGQTIPLAKGLIGAVGAVGEKTFGEGGVWSGIKDWGIQGYQDGMAKLAPLQHENDDVTVAWDKAKQGDLGALADWAAYGLGYGAVQLGESAITGGVGALIGKGIAKTAAKTAVERMVATQAAKIAATEAGKKLGQDALMAAATRSVANKISVIGAGVALQGYNEMMEVGSIYPEAVAQAKQEGREMTGSDLARAWGMGTLSAATESATDLLGLGAITGKIKLPGAGGRLARGATTGLIGATIEGGQESVQTMLERVGARQEVFSDEGKRDIINSAAMGALPGAIVGAGAGAIHRAQPAVRSLEDVKSGLIRSTIEAPTLDDAIRSAAAVTEISPEFVPFIYPAEPPVTRDRSPSIAAMIEAANQKPAEIPLEQQAQAALEKPAFERTATDLVRLRAQEQEQAAKAQPLVNAQGQPFNEQPKTAMQIAFEAARARKEQPNAETVRGATQEVLQGSQEGQSGVQPGAVQGGRNLQQPTQEQADVVGTSGRGQAQGTDLIGNEVAQARTIEEGGAATSPELLAAPKPQIAPGADQVQTPATPTPAKPISQQAPTSPAVTPPTLMGKPIADVSEKMLRVAAKSSGPKAELAKAELERRAAGQQEGEPVETFAGQYKKGMASHVATQQQKRLATERPELTWKVEAAPQFGEQRFTVNGYTNPEARSSKPVAESQALGNREVKPGPSNAGVAPRQAAALPEPSPEIAKPAAEPRVTESQVTAQKAGESVVSEVIKSGKRSAEQLRNRISDVRYGPIVDDQNTILFNLDGKPQQGLLVGRNSDLVLGSGKEMDSGIAARVFLDGNANAATQSTEIAKPADLKALGKRVDEALPRIGFGPPTEADWAGAAKEVGVSVPEAKKAWESLNLEARVERRAEPRAEPVKAEEPTIRNATAPDLLRAAAAKMEEGAKPAAPAQAKPKEGEPRFSRADWYYSQLQRAVEQKGPGTGTPEQWRAFLSSGSLKQMGVKADEIQWSGVTDWLAMQQGKVSKAQVVDFLNGNGVRVEEVELGDKSKAELDAAWLALTTHLVANESFTERGAREYAVDAARGALSPAQLQYQSERTRELSDELERLHEKRESGPQAQGVGETKFHSYQLPGGENYRELLLTLPDGHDRAAIKARLGQIADEMTWVGAAEYARLHDERARLANEYTGRDGNQFKSSHFDQPNILAHIRFNERTDAEGKRVLFIEEIQSDWAQKGKKEGFRYTPTDLPDGYKLVEVNRNDPDREKNGTGHWRIKGPDGRFLGVAYLNRGDAITGTFATFKREAESKIPSAPFVTKTEAWVALALKRMIRYAAENGFDRVAWTTGEQQAGRYDLSKQLSSVEATKNSDETGYRIVGRNNVMRNGRGNVVLEQNVFNEDLPNVVGKDLADKIARDGGGTYSGIDLKVGGEGMRAFYDKIVPNVANDVLKKLGGGRVGITKMPGSYEVRASNKGDWYVVDEAVESADMAKRGVAGPFKTEVEAQAVLDEIGGAPQPGFDITPAMRERAMEGQPLFSRGTSTQQISPRDLQAVVDTAKRSFSNLPEIVTLESPADAPAELKQAIDEANASDKIEAVFHYGTIYLFRTRIANMERAEHVLLSHELRHYGLRGTLGPGLDPVLRNLYLQNRALRERANAIRKKFGLSSIAEATEEAMVETPYDELVRLTGWRKFVLYVRDALRNMGFNGLADLVDAHLQDHYGAEQTSAMEITRILQVAEEWVRNGRQPPKSWMSGTRFGEGDRFSRAGDMISSAIPQPVKDRASKIADALIYNYQDRFVDLRRFQKQAGPVPESQDASLAEEMYPGRVRARIDDFHDDMVNPLVKVIHDAKLKYEEVEEYLHAKHAPSRNAAMLEINPTVEELDTKKADLTKTRDKLAKTAEVQDYIAKRRELRQTEADIEDGIADETAGQILRDEIAALRQETNVRDYTQAVDRLKALRNAKPFTGDNTALSGMSDKAAEAVIEKSAKEGKVEALERVSGMVDAITARTRQIFQEAGLETPEAIAAWEAKYDHYVPLFREEVGGDNPVIGQGFNIRGRESKRATGSQKAVADILAHVMAQHEAAIIRSEKSKVDRALFEFATAHPDEDLWVLDQAEMTRTVDPVSGLVVERVNPLYKQKPNVLSLKIDGQEHTITFNERSPEAVRLAAAMKNLSSADLGEITIMVGKFTRLLATMNTAANPVFVARNFLRDLQTAFVNLSDTELADMKKQVFADVPRAIRGFWQMARGNTKGEWGKFAREFRDAGGQTGWLDHYKDIGARAEKLQQTLANMEPGKWNFTKREAAAWWSLIEDANLAVENGVRLSAYVNARKAGMTEAKAASIAKNLTVNFNRHGAKGVELNMWYMFMNASIQGTARLVKAAGNKNVQKILGYVIASGFLLSLLAQSLAGDDDNDGENDYDQLPEYVKDKNFVFWVGRPITIPMPYGYNFFATVGRKMQEMMFRKNYGPGRAAADLASSFLDAFSPMSQSASLLQFAAPTVADPFIQWAENKNFAGNPLRREQLPFGPPKPEYQMGFRSTSAPAKWLAELLNDYSGGNEVRPGVLNLNPAAVDFSVTSVAGGAGRSYLQMLSLPMKAFSGEDIQAREVPFANIFMSAKPEYQVERKFYENLRKVQTTADEAKHYRGDPTMTAKLREERGAELRLTGSARILSTQLERLRKQERLLEKDKPEGWRDRTKLLEARKRELMASFNKRYVAATQ